MAMNYDPNLVYCGRRAMQRVRLTFGMWEYRKTMEVEVGGNCLGHTVIDAAVGIAYEDLEQRGIYGTEKTYAVLLLQKPEAPDDTMECDEEDMKGECWLGDMLIAAEIISIEPRDES